MFGVHQARTQAQIPAPLPSCHAEVAFALNRRVDSGVTVRARSTPACRGSAAASKSQNKNIGMSRFWDCLSPGCIDPLLGIPVGPDTQAWWERNANVVMEAAWRKRWDIVAMALGQGFPVGANCRNSDGYTLLHAAAARGHVPTVRQALAAGADPNARTRRRKTPVHYAAARGKAAALALLLDAGGDPGAAWLWATERLPGPGDPLADAPHAPCGPCSASHRTVRFIVRRPRTQAAACLQLLMEHPQVPCNWWELVVSSQASPDFPTSRQLSRAQLDEVREAGRLVHTSAITYDSMSRVCVAVCE